MKGIEGKVVWITGSSRGIGAAIAHAFAANGAKVALHGRDEAALASVHDAIAKTGAAVTRVTGELASFAAVDAMRAQIEADLGSIDIVVANAGGSFAKPGPIEDLSEDDFRRSIDGNLTSAFLTVKSVLPGMKGRRRGVILTVSSTAGRRPHPRSPIAYAAAKAGLELFTQDVAMQVGPFGVRACCIAPETILTEKNRERIPDALKEELAATHPIPRLGVPDDVAQAALFLASDSAAWITGIILDVAGGATMVR